MKLCIITGESSGDLHAASVVAELRKLDPTLDVFGMGGERLAAEGMRIVHGIESMGVVGLFNVIKQIPMFKRVFDKLIATIEAERPDAVMLVDFPDFNLRLARRCKALGIKVIYFISPQVWAWRKTRVKLIARDVDHMLVLFPFEEEFYRKHNVPVTYVGHPLVDQLEPMRLEKGEPHTPLKLALLPGSRRSEVASLLRTMVDAALELRKRRPVDAQIIKANTISRAQIDELLGSDKAAFTVVEGDGRNALAASDLCFASSGTATLEAAILGVPSVVMYRLSRLTHIVAKRLVKIPDFSLVNIVAGSRIVPELLQEEVTTAQVVREAEKMLEPEAWRGTQAALADVRARLGVGGASARAAAKIVELVQG
jgi:lipid-A-disaccharide synthase